MNLKRKGFDLKSCGLIVTLLGALLSCVSGVIDDKLMETRIKDEVDRVLAEKQEEEEPEEEP